MVRQRKSKRQVIRDEKRSRRLQKALADPESRASKRQKWKEDEARDLEAGFLPFGSNAVDNGNGEGNAQPEREFFGMLTDEEQEEFRRIDEELEQIQVPSDEFPSEEHRQIYIDKVMQQTTGKALKLASSQSCSRLMERLILLSTTRHKKALFAEFTSHFLSLVTHRFASHCCEKLFLESAPVVTEEFLGLEAADGVNKAAEATEADQPMEQLFLLMLDELEGHLPSLLTDRFASHTLRVLLVVLSGRPLDAVANKSLLRSKKKEDVTVNGAHTRASDLRAAPRPVPESFTLATRKIIADSTYALDPTALRVLAQHPTGNPVLQLLLELDMTLRGTDGKRKEKYEETLLSKLLPDAPASLEDPKSQASQLVSGLLYDPVGSRLLETLITHCPGRIFKGIYGNIMGPKIQGLLRNEIASYPAIKALNRLSKEDLAEAVKQSLPLVPSLLERGRYNVLQALFERCEAREAQESTKQLMEALADALPQGLESLVPIICFASRRGEPGKNGTEERTLQGDEKNQAAAISHGCSLAVAMLKLPGAPSEAVQASLMGLSSGEMLTLATTSNSTASLLIAALTTTQPKNKAFHKLVVAALMNDLLVLAESPPGHRVLNRVAVMPCKGDGSLPFHNKEGIMTRLGGLEEQVKQSWTGRDVWRTWKGDLWKWKRYEWTRWIKDGVLATP
jgi:nucleolar protein 9